MFHVKEINSIDLSYFELIQCSLLTITIRSKNSGHYWHIEHLDYGHFKSCRIYHRHNEKKSYHLQGYAPTLKEVIQTIKDHDYYQINIRKKIG